MVAKDGNTPKMGVVCFQLPGYFDTFYPGEKLLVPVKEIPMKIPIQFTVFLFNDTLEAAYSVKGSDLCRTEIETHSGCDYFLLPKGLCKFYDLSIFLKKNFPGATQSDPLESP